MVREYKGYCKYQIQMRSAGITEGAVEERKRYQGKEQQACRIGCFKYVFLKVYFEQGSG